MASETLNLFGLYKLFALGDFPHSKIFSTFGNAIYSAVATYNYNKGHEPLFWLHSLLLVLLTGLAGGIICPIILGKPIAPVTTEYLIPMFTFTWYITHKLELTPFLEYLPVKLAWLLLLALYKTQSITYSVKTAKYALDHTEFYDIPLIGPIVVGTLAGCFSQFMPLDKGLYAVKKGVSWTLQGAFITAAFYHIMVNDEDGFFGTLLRAVIGTYTEQETKIILFTMHLITFYSQALFDKEATFFTAINKLAYFVFHFTGPSDKKEEIKIVSPSKAVDSKKVKESEDSHAKVADDKSKHD